jgi:hypothetical protein
MPFRPSRDAFSIADVDSPPKSVTLEPVEHFRDDKAGDWIRYARHTRATHWPLMSVHLRLSIALGAPSSTGAP